MAKIFNDYLVGEEREIAIQEAYYTNLFAKLDAMYEMVSIQHEQMMRDAEYKVFSESGTYDDLEFFMEQAVAETSENQRGIIQKIFDAIGGFISKIVNGIKNLFGLGNKEDEVEVDSGVVEFITNVKTSANDIKSKMNAGNIIAALGAVAAAITGGGFVVKETGKVIKKKRGEIEGDINLLSDFLEYIKGFADKAKSFFGSEQAKGKESEGKKDANILQKFISAISTAINKLGGSLKGAVDKVKDMVTGKENPNQENIDYKKAAAKNGVTIVNLGGYEYRVDKSTGKVTRVKDGVEEDVAENMVPANIKALVQRAKGKAAMAAQAPKADTFDPEKDGAKVKLSPFMTPVKNIVIDQNTGNIYFTKNKRSELVKANDLQKYVADPVARKKIWDKATEIKKTLRSARVQESVFEDFEVEGIDFAFEAVDPEISEILESGLIITETEDAYIISESVEEEVEHPENYVESVETSIFGYSLETEKMMQESAKFDSELDELSKLFADI